MLRLHGVRLCLQTQEEVQRRLVLAQLEAPLRSPRARLGPKWNRFPKILNFGPTAAECSPNKMHIMTCTLNFCNTQPRQVCQNARTHSHVHPKRSGLETRDMAHSTRQMQTPNVASLALPPLPPGRGAEGRRRPGGRRPGRPPGRPAGAPSRRGPGGAAAPTGPGRSPGPPPAAGGGRRRWGINWLTLGWGAPRHGGMGFASEEQNVAP